ncbi:MAG TPA: hypothetical protein VFQ35_27795 [Polyangiaceae bacterium]|nr:hypothetical protein [Polyangiaceae bacterium]
MGGDSNPFDHYTLDFNLAGGGTAVELGIDEAAATLANALTTGVTVKAGLDNIAIKELKASLEAKITQLVPIDLKITQLPKIVTDSKVDLGLDNIRIAELPPVQLELAVRPVRVHLPLNYTFSLELFGYRLFKFSICGEGMVVTEDYKPHATERCE